MASLKSPRPTPKFFKEAQTFSTKKERSTPLAQAPPRPPVKSAPPISRVYPFHNKFPVQKAQAVSFRASESSILSKHYNECSKDLYFDQCFEIHSKLGAGSFGEVFKVKSIEDGKFYAVKRSRERFRGESDRKRKLEEVAKHEKLPKHPNCIKFIKAWEERQHLYIQTELCELSLNHYSEQNHDIPEKIIWNYLVDLLLAVKHLHDHDLIHMDIKPANIFISADGICKLGDFGLVLDLSKGDLSEALEGDPMYLAPELLEGKFTKAADIFSLGITILELACDLDLPRGGHSWHQLRQNQIPFDNMRHLSSSLSHVIKWLMHPDYKERPTIDEVLHLPLVAKVWQRRKKELWTKAAVTTFQDVVHYIVTYITVVWTLSAKPIMYLIRLLPRPLSSPSHTPLHKPARHPSEWDYSFSDDDCFEDEISNVSCGSAGINLGDVSSSSESKNGSFISTSFTEKQVNSTPAANRRRSPTEGGLGTPGSIPLLDWDSYRFSPVNSPVSLSKPTVPEKFNVGPKNLLEVFEAAASSEEEDI